MILVWEQYQTKTHPYLVGDTFEQVISELPVEAGRQHKKPRVESTVAANILKISNSLGVWYLQEIFDPQTMRERYPTR